MHRTIQSLFTAAVAAAAMTPAHALMNHQDETLTLPSVTVTINAHRLDEAFGMQTIAEKFWAEVGQRYDGMAEFRNVGGVFQADAVYARVCLPDCVTARRQPRAIIMRRPRETFRSAFSRAFARGQLSQRLAAATPLPAAARTVGDARYGESFCIYGECSTSDYVGPGGSLTCAASINGRRFCARL
ncbi:hypothetical protein BH24PSE2_BH24PSE2_24580 [soil metagenome]